MRRSRNIDGNYDLVILSLDTLLLETARSAIQNRIPKNAEVGRVSTGTHEADHASRRTAFVNDGEIFRSADTLVCCPRCDD